MDFNDAGTVSLESMDFSETRGGNDKTVNAGIRTSDYIGKYTHQRGVFCLPHAVLCMY